MENARGRFALPNVAWTVGIVFVAACNGILGIEPGRVAQAGAGGSTTGGGTHKSGAGTNDGGTDPGSAGRSFTDVGGTWATGGLSSTHSQNLGGTFAAGGSTTNAGSATTMGGGASGAAGTQEAGGSDSGGMTGTSNHGAGGKAIAGEAGVAGNAGSAGNCPTCAGRIFRMRGYEHTKALGSPTGGGPVYDLCPKDQVLVGLSFRSATETYYNTEHFINTTAICAPLVRSSATEIPIGQDFRLPARGEARAGVAEQTVHCAPGTVVTSYFGAQRSGPDSPTGIQLGCSKLSTMGNAVAIEEQQTTPFLGINPNQQVLEPVGCPTGHVARGLLLRTGLWIDSLALICGMPGFAHPDGTPCQSDIECIGGRCNQTCQPMLCPAPTGCSCELFGTTSYVLCLSSQPNFIAMETCKAAGLAPARMDTPQEIGWLSMTMFHNWKPRFWLGAHGVNNEWTWDDPPGKIMASATTGEDDPNNFWAYSDSDDTDDGRTCLISNEGRYYNWVCDESLPFACELKP